MIELQKLDCNCSDCGFFERSLSRRQTHVDFHYLMQKEAFDRRRIKLLEKGEWWLWKKKNKAKAKVLFKEARAMKFQFDESKCSLVYGYCRKFEKQVSAIPNTLQLHTQDCFLHRSLNI